MAPNKTVFFSPIDEYLGQFISSLHSKPQYNVQLAASLISRNLRDGHVCLNLNEYAGKFLQDDENQEKVLIFPELSNWVENLKNDQCVGSPGEFKPLILDKHNRLYFHRYWQYEQDIVNLIRQRLNLISSISAKRENLQSKLRFYFPEMVQHEVYWPAVAAVASLYRKFLVITGSPGTGKTTTIAKILAFLNDISEKNRFTALCAPTGKAAQRLESSIRNLKISSQWSEEIKNSIPNEATTIHRLLGSVRYSPYFQYNENNLLPYDLVVVDESSMVDLPLMAKLMNALSTNAQLILLGDKDQLASVEAGAVLGNICYPHPLNEFSDSFEKVISDIYGKKANVNHKPPGIHDCIVELKQNYRFHEDSGLSIISQAIKDVNCEKIDAFLKVSDFSDVHFNPLYRTKKMAADMLGLISEFYRDYLNAVNLNDRSPEDMLELFERYRVLCALRGGFWGVEQMNRLLEKSFADKGLINLNSLYYAGRPVMVVQNDYQKKLFNGDIGIVLRDPSDENKLKVFFRDKDDGIRKLSPERLPRHETVWAMTVHKSQGSEFDRIALILTDMDNPLLTRELIYTGITRARVYAGLWSDPKILIKAIKNPTTRHSGLTDALIQET